jgi:hypothetical protein
VHFGKNSRQFFQYNWSKKYLHSAMEENVIQVWNPDKEAATFDEFTCGPERKGQSREGCKEGKKQQ